MVGELGAFPVLWFLRHGGLAGGVMVGLFAVAGVLTWRDPIIRTRVLPLGIALAGWASMAVLPLLMLLFGGREGAAALLWIVAGLYALCIVATLGRPLLIFSDLFDDAEGEISPADQRRSTIGQFVLIAAICAAVVIVMA
ncbi:hypothetical protein [Kribbella solani]|uniref:hypothetical protein n=2 Tax=Kribbella solani TaxID=236067 RepID=UPI0029AEF895|nr:hypothetical protein [Kribbella solani]MDX2974543.1 hypothetical protein [Kribbella solani]